LTLRVTARTESLTTPKALHNIAQETVRAVLVTRCLDCHGGDEAGYVNSFARKLIAKGDKVTENVVERAYLTALSRKPSKGESDAGLRFFEQLTQSYRADGLADAETLALADFCQVLMSLNEFVFVQ
jgi:hypothetical protein